MCGALHKQKDLTTPLLLHCDRRGQDIQLIREGKVDFSLDGPITVGALVNLANKVMAGVGGHLGKSEAKEKGRMKGSTIRTEGKIAGPLTAQLAWQMRKLTEQKHLLNL